MSLLRLKPAPTYILDEIDAASELFHTQHIGQLFRTRFKGSQIIVASFTKANVLFRDKFGDGTSMAERNAQRSTSSLYINDDANVGDERIPRRSGGPLQDKSICD